MSDTIEQRIMMGDEQAFELLYRRYYARLCAFANKFLFDPQSSEEVVQDIFLKLWENRKTLQDGSSGKSFLFQAVHNKSLNLLAHQKVAVKYSEMIKAVYSHPEEFDVHESLIAKELQKKILIVVNDLPPECRRIFMMSRSQGKKQLEIASELNISVKTVETQINRALKRLKIELSDYLTVLISILFLNS